MTIAARLRATTLGALMLVASVGVAAAGGGSPGEAPDRGSGASGRGDGSGMGQDNTESGTPKGPGDKGPGAAAEQRLEGTSPEGSGLRSRCDDGRAPVEGACPR